MIKYTHKDTERDPPDGQDSIHTKEVLSLHHNEEAIMESGNRESRFESAVCVASELFLERGIAHVRMTEIARRTGVGVATLYRYFGTKTGIAIAAMTYLWKQLRKKFSGIFDSDVFRRHSGYKQVYDLMRMFLVLYTAHRDFLKLLGEFDLLLVREAVPKEDLEEYAQSIINFYPVFESSYQIGVSDGSVRPLPNVGLFYVSNAHSFMELSKKLLQGELLSTDDFSNGERELEMMIESAAYYLKKQ